MGDYPLISLDAHAHLEPRRSLDELSAAGAVLAMTFSLAEAGQVIARHDACVAWGVGCHPCKLAAQQSFDRDHFAELAWRSAVVGEVGLDGESRVPLEQQLRTFRQVLQVLTEMPRLVSIHSYRATGLVLEELRRQPVAVPVLHWWTGNAEETRTAVALGCYFSVHSAVARHSKFRKVVPAERILVESDHGWADPPQAIPCRIEWVEHLLGQQLNCSWEAVRRLAWRNLATIVAATGTLDLLPARLAELVNLPRPVADS